MIRKATLGDAPLVLTLIRKLAEYERLAPPDVEAEKRLVAHGWGNPPMFDTWLVEVDGSPVGYSICFLTYSTFLARPTLYVEDVFVLPNFRGQGCGTALFRAMACEALRRDCGRMEWSCLTWNTPSLQFYARIGAIEMVDWRPIRMDHAEIEAFATVGSAD